MDLPLCLCWLFCEDVSVDGVTRRFSSGVEVARGAARLVEDWRPYELRSRELPGRGRERDTHKANIGTQ